MVGRHAHGDQVKTGILLYLLAFALTTKMYFQYKATDLVIPGAGDLELVFKPADGSATQTFKVNSFKGKGVAMGMYNTYDSIVDFAHCCLKYALNRGFPLYMSTKNTILKGILIFFVFSLSKNKH